MSESSERTKLLMTLSKNFTSFYLPKISTGVEILLIDSEFHRGLNRHIQIIQPKQRPDSEKISEILGELIASSEPPNLSEILSELIASSEPPKSI